MYWEMLTDSKAQANDGGATHSATSFNTSACRFAKRNPGAAAVKVTSKNDQISQVSVILKSNDNF
jgi:hypothetical protein